MTNTRKERFH